MNSHSSCWGKAMALLSNLLTLLVQPWRQRRVHREQGVDGDILAVPEVSVHLADPLLLCAGAHGGPSGWHCSADGVCRALSRGHLTGPCSGSEWQGDPCSQRSSCDHPWDVLCSVLVVPFHQCHPVKCHPTECHPTSTILPSATSLNATFLSATLPAPLHQCHPIRFQPNECHHTSAVPPIAIPPVPTH